MKERNKREQMTRSTKPPACAAIAETEWPALLAETERSILGETGVDFIAAALSGGAALVHLAHECLAATPYQSAVAGLEKEFVRACCSHVLTLRSLETLFAEVLGCLSDLLSLIAEGGREAEAEKCGETIALLSAKIAKKHRALADAYADLCETVITVRRMCGDGKADADAARKAADGEIQTLRSRRQEQRAIAEELSAQACAWAAFCDDAVDDEAEAAALVQCISGHFAPRRAPYGGGDWCESAGPQQEMDKRNLDRLEALLKLKIAHRKMRLRALDDLESLASRIRGDEQRKQAIEESARYLREALQCLGSLVVIADDNAFFWSRQADRCAAMMTSGGYGPNIRRTLKKRDRAEREAALLRGGACEGLIRHVVDWCVLRRISGLCLERAEAVRGELRRNFADAHTPEAARRFAAARVADLRKEMEAQRARNREAVEIAEQAQAAVRRLRG